MKIKIVNTSAELPYTFTHQLVEDGCEMEASRAKNDGWWLVEGEELCKHIDFDRTTATKDTILGYRWMFQTKEVKVVTPVINIDQFSFANTINKKIKLTYDEIDQYSFVPGLVEDDVILPALVGMDGWCTVEGCDLLDVINFDEVPITRSMVGDHRWIFGPREFEVIS